MIAPNTPDNVVPLLPATTQPPDLDFPAIEEAEKATLGAGIVNPHIFDKLKTTLKPDDFYMTRGRLVWRAMLELDAKSIPVDYLTLVHHLRETGKLKDVEASYVTGIINDTPYAPHGLFYGQFVKTLSRRRKLYALSDDVKRIAMTADIPLEEAAKQITKLVLDKTTAFQEQKSTLSLMDSLQQHETDLLARVKLYDTRPDYVLGVRTGFKVLDQVIGGLQKGCLHVLAAATKMGKTSLMLSMLLNAVESGIYNHETRGAKALSFSGEMKVSQLMNRLVSLKSGIPVQTLARGSLSPEQIATWGEAQKALHKLHIQHHAGSRITPTELRNWIRQEQATTGVDVVFLDGLLQITPESADKEKRLRVGSVMTALEAIALDLNVAILLTHQCSREAKNRAHKEPVLGDLAESADIERTASVVMMLYREGYYDDTCFDMTAATVYVRANRHGSPASVNLKWTAERTLFEDGYPRKVLGD